MNDVATNEVTLAEWLSGELDARNWGQGDLAEVAGVSHATVSNLVTRRKTATTDTLLKIANALETDFWLLAEMAGMMVPPGVKDMAPSVNAVAQRLHALPPVKREAAAFMINELLNGLRVYEAAAQHEALGELAAADPELAASAIVQWQRSARNGKRKVSLK